MRSAAAPPVQHHGRGRADLGRGRQAVLPADRHAHAFCDRTSRLELGRTFQAEIAHFVDAIGKGYEPLHSVAEATNTLRDPGGLHIDGFRPQRDVGVMLWRAPEMALTSMVAICYIQKWSEDLPSGLALNNDSITKVESEYYVTRIR